MCLCDSLYYSVLLCTTLSYCVLLLSTTVYYFVQRRPKLHTPHDAQLGGTHTYNASYTHTTGHPSRGDIRVAMLVTQLNKVLTTVHNSVK